LPKFHHILFSYRETPSVTFNDRCFAVNNLFISINLSLSLSLSLSVTLMLRFNLPFLYTSFTSSEMSPLCTHLHNTYQPLCNYYGHNNFSPARCYEFAYTRKVTCLVWRYRVSYKPNTVVKPKSLTCVQKPTVQHTLSVLADISMM
jgi:hypothetical protein